MNQILLNLLIIMDTLHEHLHTFLHMKVTWWGITKHTEDPFDDVTQQTGTKHTNHAEFIYS
jgi:hypothetical protein